MGLPREFDSLLDTDQVEPGEDVFGAMRLIDVVPPKTPHGSWHIVVQHANGTTRSHEFETGKAARNWCRINGIIAEDASHGIRLLGEDSEFDDLLDDEPVADTEDEFQFEDHMPCYFCGNTISENGECEECGRTVCYNCVDQTRLSKFEWYCKECSKKEFEHGFLYRPFESAGLPGECLIERNAICQACYRDASDVELCEVCGRDVCADCCDDTIRDKQDRSICRHCAGHSRF